MNRDRIASAVAGSALVTVLAFAKAKNMTREQFVELCGKAWDRWGQGAGMVREFFDAQVRAARVPR